jgi:glucosyl-dolichyl phosphate glucuronosyltransferase
MWLPAQALPMSDVAVTVLLATRNGEHVLPQVLEAYCRVESPPRSWKLVVVDNGSDDSTEDVLASFKSRLPLEACREPVLGKNRALNVGLGTIEGRLVILTDDDAVPHPSFLRAWSGYIDSALDYDLFGGTIEPLFEVAPPNWMRRSTANFDLLFSARQLVEGPIAPNEIYGPNMAVRSSVFQAGFRFNEKIGPDGSDPYYPMGSETEFCCRVVAQARVKAWFAKGPRVQHIVRSGQMLRSYWARRSYQHGRGMALQMRERGETLRSDSYPPIIKDQLWRLLQLSRLLQICSPSALQRFNGICDYHWNRGFRDEWAKRLDIHYRIS